MLRGPCATPATSRRPPRRAQLTWRPTARPEDPAAQTTRPTNDHSASHGRHGAAHLPGRRRHRLRPLLRRHGNQAITFDRPSSDHLSVAQHVANFSSRQCEEAPARSKNNGTCILTNSYCTGWSPNQNHCRSASSMAGPGTPTDGNLGDNAAYNTHAFDILPMQGASGTSGSATARTARNPSATSAHT